MQYEIALIVAPILATIFTYMLFARREELIHVFEDMEFDCPRRLVRFAGVCAGAASTVGTFAILAMVVVFHIVRFL